MLLEVAEKVLVQAIKPGLVAYCPTMDLIALATRDEQVHVFRLNGQRVFGIPNKLEGHKVVQLTWKPNGRILAIAYSSGSISLINSHTGKAVHQIDCTSHSTSQVCFLGWGVNFMEAAATRTQIKEFGKEVALDDVLSQGLKGLDLEVPLDLPGDLAFMDVEAVLPKLSVLPTGGKEDDVFASRLSIDTMFHASKKDANESADVMLVGFEDGTVHLSIYDFFEIGSFNNVHDRKGMKIVKHCSHPYSSTHGVLVADKADEPEELIFVPVDLRLIPNTGRYLSLLASKATHMQNILRYMEETQVQIYTEFELSQDLPRKFIRNIEETLQEKESTSLVNAAFHLVATGDCSPSVKEWLVDELGERGHKRWDKAAVSGYENVCRFTLQNLLPAFDRFGVLVSRLRGLSRFEESTAAFGLATVELAHVLDTLSCLQLLAHTVLINGGAELRQFTAFSKWIKQEIETQAAEPASQAAEDAAVKSGTLDYAAILQYIQGPMQHSKLYELFDVKMPNDERTKLELPPDDSTMYEPYRKALKTSEQKSLVKKLPGLSALVSRLDRQCKIIFKRIAETQKRKVRFGKPIPVKKGDIACFDATMSTEAHPDDWSLCTCYIATAMKSESIVHFEKITLKVVNGVSSTESTETASVRLPEKYQIKDVKFADDKTLVVATGGTASSSTLVFFPYSGGESTEAGLAWFPYSANIKVSKLLDLSGESSLEPYVRHTFAAEVLWTPRSLEINGRKGRRAVCVVKEDGMHYRVFDLDSLVGDEDDDAMEIASGNGDHNAA